MAAAAGDFITSSLCSSTWSDHHSENDANLQPSRKNHGEPTTVAQITFKRKDIPSLPPPWIPKNRKEEKNWGRESQDHWWSCPHPNCFFLRVHHFWRLKALLCVVLIKDAFSFQNIIGIETLVGRTPKLLLYHLQIKASALKEEREHVEKASKDKMLKL